jgi:ParB family chromosome partitioning protein
MAKAQIKLDYFSANVQTAEVEQELEQAQKRINELEELNQKLLALTGNQLAVSNTAEISLAVAQVVRDPEQVRRYFDPIKLASLTDSIKDVGIRERLWVRALPEARYLLIAGERRYRAAIAAGLNEVPVVVLDVDDAAALKLTLIENLQREDLNAVEETEGILKLLSLQIGCTTSEVIALLNRKAHLNKKGAEFDEVTENVFRSQWQILEQVFSVIGKFSPESFRVSRLPLLNLPAEIQAALHEGKIEYTKARAIARVKDSQMRQSLLQEVIENQLSLSEINSRIRSIKPTASPSLKTRFKDLSSQMLKLPVKEWEDTKKSKRIARLLEQLENLLTEHS